MLCETLYEEPLEGSLNMAIDDVRLTYGEANPDAPLCLRFYRWSEPTLSLGYFQKLEDRKLHPPSEECAIVRRASGGGAILHDHELTYSLVAPAKHPLAREPKKMYDIMHEALVAALQGFDVTAWTNDTSCSAESKTPRKEKPFLCFQRFTCMDVFIADSTNSGPDDQSAIKNKANKKKICGSAQRQRGGAVLQHGSILLRKSAMAPELPGIVDLTGKDIGPSQLAEAMLDRLKALNGWELQPEVDGQKALVPAVQNAQSRYLAPAWLGRR